MVKVEVVKPEPIQNEVVIRLPERTARQLMFVLMHGLVWDEIAYGETTVADIYRALEDAGIEEA